MRYYPVFLDLKGRHAVVVGGGSVAERKVATLLKADAKVTVVSPEVTRRLADWTAQKKIRHIGRVYREGDLDQAAIAFTATHNGYVNQDVAGEAQEKKIWINVAYQSVPGDFILPALFTKRDITVAVSSGGKDPRRAIKIRDSLKGVIT